MLSPELVLWSPSAQAETTLGTADYSYEFVLRRFLPAMATRWQVRRVEAPGEVSRGSVLLSFAPPHRTPRVPGVRVIPVFAWEFDRLPDSPFGGVPDNDWRVPLGRCGAAITHSSFAVDVTKQAMGRDYPVVSLPAPLWDDFAGGSRTRPPVGGGLDIDGIVVDTAEPGWATSALVARRLDLRWRGPLFTAVLNPEDGRKNWPDLVSGFIFALRDRPDATLLMKVVHADPERGVEPIRRGLALWGDFRCRVVVAQTYLPDDSYRSLVDQSTFVVNTSRGEGQCLPLMEFMSAGVPAIAPDHTAMADYVSADNSFVLPSGREPSAWPQDPRLLFTCHRRVIDWGALVAGYRRAYLVATGSTDAYLSMSAAAVASTHSYCSSQKVLAGLERFLDGLASGGAA